MSGSRRPRRPPDTQRRGGAEQTELTELRLFIADEIERAASRLGQAIADRDMGHAGPRDLVGLVQDTLGGLASRLRAYGDGAHGELVRPAPNGDGVPADEPPAYDLSGYDLEAPTPKRHPDRQPDGHPGASAQESTRRSAARTSDEPLAERASNSLITPPLDELDGAEEEPTVFRCVICGEDAVIPYDNVLTCVCCGQPQP